MKMVNLRRPPVGVNLQGASYFGGMADVNDHVARVAAGGGAGANESDLFKIYRFLHSQGLLSGTRLLWTPEAGYVQRVDGVLKYCRTGFDTSLFENDLDGSATASQQPRLVGGIAPGSKVAASNQNGESRYFTHPAISFAATDAWSVNCMIRWNGLDSSSAYAGGGVNTKLTIRYGGALYPTHGISFRNESGTPYPSLGDYRSYIGKNSLLTFVADGTGNLKLYGNGVLLSSNSAVTNAVFSGLLSFDPTRHLPASISAYHIQSGAMSAAQVLAEYNLLRSMYPEIESVQIGTQTWASRNFEAVATPMGNVIANVTDNAAWANATVLYDAAYAAHVGDAAAKEYAGLKAAAMWCYYNNDPANGAIYGKLYNWYAAKLLDLDMVTAGFGWRVPTSAQWTTLANAQGGTSVAGGKMKMTGEDYWLTPNTGATNESGFTALGGGFRGQTGTFFNFNVLNNYVAISESAGLFYTLSYNNSEFLSTITGFDKNRGVSIRLIKE